MHQEKNTAFPYISNNFFLSHNDLSSAPYEVRDTDSTSRWKSNYLTH